MKANKEYYLRFRKLFISMGYNTEVKMLDNHYSLTLIYDNNNTLKYIL